MLNSGWTSLNPNKGRVTLGKKFAQFGAFSPAPKVPEKKFVVQSCDLFKPGWKTVTPEVSEGMADDLMTELIKNNRKMFYRIQEVK